MQNTPKKFSVTIDPHAYEMLLGHADFLWGVSPSAADRFKEALVRMADNPFQFPFADELDVSNLPPKTYIKCLFEKRYKALFRLGESEVLVDVVIDSRMENKSI